MKRIVIFGATGAIGAYAAAELSKYYEVIAVGRRDDHDMFEDINIEYIRANCLNKNDLRRVPSEKYAVINLAGMLPAAMHGYSPEDYINNMMIQLNILDYSKGCDRVLFAQSVSDVVHLYGSGTIPENITHRFPINNDHSVYSICKNASVDLMQHYSERYGYRWIAIRMPHIYLYHPNSYYYSEGVLKKMNHRQMIEDAIEGKEIKVWGPPEKQRDIIYVKDLIAQIKVLLETDAQGMYNAGTGTGTTIEDQVKGIVKVFGGSIGYDPGNTYNVAQYVMDISRSKVLGYTPRYDYVSYLTDFKTEMQLNRFEKIWGKQ